MEQKTFCVIYKITNSVNGKIYIGQSINFENRMRHHLYEARTGGTTLPLYNAIRKYGWGNFTVEIIFCAFGGKSLDLAEKHFIKEYKSKDLKFGYNLTEGGGGQSGRVCSEETRLKMSLAKKDKKQSEESIQKRRLANTGKIHTEEQNLNKSLRGKGKKHTPESKLNMSLAHIGKKQTEESIQKRAAAAFKPILQFNKFGEFLNEYPSVKAAASVAGICRVSVGCAARGKQKSAGGFLWRYKEETT